MGDRTYCSLKVWGEITGVQLSKLVGMILGAEPVESAQEVREALGTGSDVGFDSVNHGQMDAVLYNFLKGNRLPFAWSWGAGACYGSGVTLFDGDAEETFGTADGEIVLNLHAATNPELLAHAQRWNLVGAGEVLTVVRPEPSEEAQATVTITNEKRRAWAEEAVRAYQMAKLADPHEPEAAQDLITDLLHLINAGTNYHGVGVAIERLSSAVSHFVVEDWHDGEPGDNPVQVEVVFTGLNTLYSRPRGSKEQEK